MSDSETTLGEEGLLKLCREGDLDEALEKLKARRKEQLERERDKAVADGVTVQKKSTLIQPYTPGTLYGLVRRCNLDCSDAI